ncbi:MAG: hypothetical protein IJR54_08535 [Oscillibacter sp.]|nr:hypothetical protein [Oscillibacter sp.]
MAAIQFVVSPEKLRITAEEMLDVLRNIRSRAARIGDISGRTRGYWQGDAGEEERTGYRACNEELVEAARRLERRSIALLKLGGLYQETENEAEGVNMKLNVDSILSK